ncbi:MAG: hypothetical protein AAF221_05290 [Pseudomonadota bacterium]
MEAALLSGIIMQAAIILGLALLIAVLTQRVRRLSAILPPAGALVLSGGPAAGERLPKLAISMLDGATCDLGGVPTHDKQKLLFFFSPTCPISKAMLPIVKSYAVDYDVIFATDGDGSSDSHKAFASTHQLDTDHYCVSELLGRSYGIGRVPQAVLLSTDGTIAARGLVNNREHVDSLINAAETATPTIQSYLVANQAEA